MESCSLESFIATKIHALIGDIGSGAEDLMSKKEITKRVEKWIKDFEISGRVTINFI